VSRVHASSGGPPVRSESHWQELMTEITLLSPHKRPVFFGGECLMQGGPPLPYQLCTNTLHTKRHPIRHPVRLNSKYHFNSSLFPREITYIPTCCDSRIHRNSLDDMCYLVQASLTPCAFSSPSSAPHFQALFPCPSLLHFAFEILQLTCSFTTLKPLKTSTACSSSLLFWSR
jgi:hypothetical protein